MSKKHWPPSCSRLIVTQGSRLCWAWKTKGRVGNPGGAPRSHRFSDTRIPGFLVSMICWKVERRSRWCLTKGTATPRQRDSLGRLPGGGGSQTGSLMREGNSRDGGSRRQGQFSEGRARMWMEKEPGGGYPVASVKGAGGRTGSGAQGMPDLGA